MHEAPPPAPAEPAGRVPAVRRSCAGSDRLLIGPATLAVTSSVLQAMFLWDTFWRREPKPAELASFTAEGQAWFRPDYDMPIYVGFVVVAVLLASLVCAVWRTRLQNEATDRDRQFSCFLAWAHLPLAAVCMLLPLANFQSGAIKLLSGLLALVAAVGLAFVSYPTVAGLRVGVRRCRRAISAGITLAALVLVVLLLYCPDVAALSSRVFLKDGFHHWSFYAMAPALAYRHGAALGSEFYSQYGVGWPMLFARLSHFVPLAYKTMIGLGMLWGCIYFATIYFFLRSVLRSAGWALAGMSFALSTQAFCGTEGVPIWVWPSSSILRTPLDVLLFWSCWRYAQTREPWLAAAIGGLAGLSVLFSTETGFYALIAVAFYLLMLGRTSTDPAHHVRRFALWVAGTALTVILAGLALAARGTLFTAAFWRGWTESLRLYSSGVSALPIRGATAEPATYLLLFLVLGCYAMAVIRALQGAWYGSRNTRCLLEGMIGVYGFGTLMVFINRSHPYNLFHPIVPFCLLATMYCADAAAGAARRLAAGRPPGIGRPLRDVVRCLPLVCTAVVLIGLFKNPNFQEYPNVLHRRLLFEASLGPRHADAVCLFAARHDVPLPRETHAGMAAAFQAVADLLSELRRDGRRVAMIAWDDTNFLVEPDLAPYFRYSPVLTILHRGQLETVRRTLADDPPDVVLALVRPQDHGADVMQELRGAIELRFTLERTLYGVQVYRRTK